jgi:2'-5' RNA ligase
MRLFVAVPLPDELKAKIADLGKEIEQDGIKLVKPENMHITLKFIGDVEEHKIGDIEQSLREASFSGFTCDAKGVGVFPNENYIRVVWTGAESDGKLEALAEKVGKALAGYGKKDRFSSHITIARVKRRVDLKAFLEKHRQDELGPFDVSRFELMSSELKPGGPEYSVVATFEAQKDA